MPAGQCTEEEGAHAAIPTVKVSVAVVGRDMSVFQDTVPPRLGSGKCVEGMLVIVRAWRMTGLVDEDVMSRMVGCVDADVVSRMVCCGDDVRWYA